MRLLAAVAGALALALASAAVAGAFDNTEPLAAKQWYLEQDNAWDFWPTVPQLYPVKVAIVDSGIDRGHPSSRPDRRRPLRSWAPVVRRRRRPRDVRRR
jgi:hypothetical protein